MARLPAGVLRHRVKIRRPTEVQNERKGYKTEWHTLADVFAEVIGQDGKESVMDKVLQGISVYRVRIRWRADIKTSDQLSSAGDCFGGREVNIKSAVDPDGRREQLVIIAETSGTRATVQ